jgi:hypothetical protein
MYLIYLLNMQYENVTTQTQACCWLQPVDRILLSHQYMTLFTWCCIHIYAYKNCTINLTSWLISSNTRGPFCLKFLYEWFHSSCKICSNEEWSLIIHILPNFQTHLPSGVTQTQKHSNQQSTIFRHYTM